MKAMGMITALALAMALADTAKGAPGPMTATDAISFHRAEDAPAYANLAGKARELAKSFFRRLKSSGLIGDLMRANGEKSFSPGLLFSKLQPTPLREIDGCQAVFCRDVDLQKILNDEMKGGRLVLVTNSYNGFVAAMVNDTPETVALKRVLTPDAHDRSANVLIVTPKTLISSIEHERMHADDAANGALKPLLASVRALHGKGALTVGQARAIQQFAGEVRAYEREMRFLVKNSRPVEFVADDGVDGTTPVIRVNTEDRRAFILRRLAEIDMKVRDWYLPAFLTAMKESSLGAKDRRALTASVRGLLPKSGPFSYDKLVEPKMDVARAF